MTTRDDIIEALREGLCDIDLFRAAWLGGSDAMGRADELSDIDLAAFVCDGTIDQGFGHVRRVLEGVATVEHEWRLPSPTWHGSEQTFFKLARLGTFGCIDVVLEPSRERFEFLVAERHGRPTALFDHDGLVRATPYDPGRYEQKRRERVETARKTFLHFAHIADKEARRGRSIDAAYFGLHMVVRPLVDVLRAVHCPERFDFGLRYLDDDLPKEITREIETMMYPGSPEMITGLVERAQKLMDEALAAWDAAATSCDGSGRS